MLPLQLSPLTSWYSPVKEVLGTGVVHGKPPAMREDGWETWLHKHRLWDPSAPATCMYTRYLKLSSINFTAVHKS